MTETEAVRRQSYLLHHHAIKFLKKKKNTKDQICFLIFRILSKWQVIGNETIHDLLLNGVTLTETENCERFMIHQISGSVVSKVLALLSAVLSFPKPD